MEGGWRRDVGSAARETTVDRAQSSRVGRAMASRTTDAARQVFTGEGVARCAAFHERRAQERDALADRPIDANDLLPDGVEWVAAGSIVMDADATTYRPPPMRDSLKVRRKQRREDAEAVLQPANAVPCLAHGANGARGAVVTEKLEERREEAAAPAPPVRLQVPTALRRRQRRSSMPGMSRTPGHRDLPGLLKVTETHQNSLKIGTHIVLNPNNRFANTLHLPDTTSPFLVVVVV